MIKGRHGGILTQTDSSEGWNITHNPLRLQQIPGFQKTYFVPGNEWRTQYLHNESIFPVRLFQRKVNF